jgi:transcriptional regulator with XRE-family HTH domain
MSINKTDIPAGDTAHFSWDSALAHYTVGRREELGLTIAAAAELSGLSISQWCDLEAGWVPADLALLRAIARLLQVRWRDYHTLALLSAYGQLQGEPVRES